MDLFQVLARKTFSRRGKVEAQSVELLGSWWHVMSMFLRLSQSKYEPSPLRDALKELFGESTSLFSSSQERGRQCAVRVAVTSKKSLNATNCLMASYNRPEFTDDSFEREDNCDKDTRVWEAGMATSAAPFYFPAFKRADGGGVDYIDGALFANCPASVALEEINKLWPDGQARLDILCSVGTGIQKTTSQHPKLTQLRRVRQNVRLLLPEPGDRAGMDGSLLYKGRKGRGRPTAQAKYQDHTRKARFSRRLAQDGRLEQHG